MTNKNRFTQIAKYVSQLLLTEVNMTADVNHIYKEVSKIWKEISLIPNEILEKKYVTQVISQMKRQNIITLISQEGRNNTYKVSDENILRNIESGDHVLKQMNKQAIIQLKHPPHKKNDVKSEKLSKEPAPQSSTPYADKIRDIPLSPLEIGMGLCELVGSQNDKINKMISIIDSLQQDKVNLNGTLKFQKNRLSDSEDHRLDLEDGIKELEDKIARDAKQFIAKEQQLQNQIRRLTEINAEKDKEIVELKARPHPNVKFSSLSQLSAVKLHS